MKQEYIEKITKEIKETNDLMLLDLVYKILVKTKNWEEEK